MRTLALFLGFAISAQAFAVDSAKIKKVSETICKFAKGCETKTLKGKTLQEMLTNWQLEIDYISEASEAEFADLGDKTPGADELVWGKMSMKGALNMVEEHVTDHQTLTEKQAKVIKDQIKSLVGSGVEFGFTSMTGGVVCGVSFPGLLIIDMVKKKATDVKLFGYPDC